MLGDAYELAGKWMMTRMSTPLRVLRRTAVGLKYELAVEAGSPQYQCLVACLMERLPDVVVRL